MDKVKYTNRKYRGIETGRGGDYYCPRAEGPKRKTLLLEPKRAAWWRVTR